MLKEAKFKYNLSIGGAGSETSELLVRICELEGIILFLQAGNVSQQQFPVFCGADGIGIKLRGEDLTICPVFRKTGGETPAVRPRFSSYCAVTPPDQSGR